MQVDLRLLKQAMALVENGSFSRAADALGVSQPTLSRSIKELEERVGLALFNRDRSGIAPTDFGQVFMEHARDLLARATDLEREVALAKGLQSGEVGLGLGAHVVEALGPQCAARFAAAYPAVRLRIVSDSPAAVARALRARTVDIAVADASALDEDDLEVLLKLPPIDGYVIVRTGHPLCGKSPVQMSAMLDYPYAQVVMLPPRMLRPILSARTGRGAKPRPPFPAIECPSVRLATNIVAGSEAFTFATLSMIREELEGGRVVPLFREPWMRTEWNIVRLRKRSLSPAMAALVEELKRTHAEVRLTESSLCDRHFVNTPRSTSADGVQVRKRTRLQASK
jgi:DNA-binding transcriptional LysR family regulator